MKKSFKIIVSYPFSYNIFNLDGISILCGNERSILFNGNVFDHISHWNGTAVLWVLFSKLKVNPRWIINQRRSAILSPLLDIRFELYLAHGHNSTNV